MRLSLLRLGGGVPPKLPDWRIYKWENVKYLVQTQKKLSQYGLKDPFIRNYVWQFHPQYGTKLMNNLRFCFDGCAIGFLLGVASLAFEKWYFTRVDSTYYSWTDRNFPEDAQRDPLDPFHNALIFKSKHHDDHGGHGGHVGHGGHDEHGQHGTATP